MSNRNWPANGKALIDKLYEMKRRALAGDPDLHFGRQDHLTDAEIDGLRRVYADLVGNGALALEAAAWCGRSQCELCKWGNLAIKEEAACLAFQDGILAKYLENMEPHDKVDPDQYIKDEALVFTPYVLLNGADGLYPIE